MNIKAPVVATTVVMLVIASAGIVSSAVFAQQSQNTHFIAKLSAKAAPGFGPNLSFNATGKATFTVTGGGKAMQYSVNANKINHVGDVTLVLYASGRGHPASNVVLMRRAVTQGPTGPINGLLVQGNIKPSDLVGPLNGKQISVLVKDMLDGKVDLWVTTTAAQLIAGTVIPASAAELAAPSANATKAPSANATAAAPSANATKAPSANATAAAPSANATKAPSANATKAPSANATKAPSANATKAPSANATAAPSANATAAPSANATATKH